MTSRHWTEHYDARRRSWPVSFEEWEARAAEELGAGPFGYIAGGAGSEATIRENYAALDRWALIPRMLGSSPCRSFAVNVLGTEAPAPIFLAPIGLQSIARPGGDLEVARAAASLGLPLVVSTAASEAMERVAEAAQGASKWFQLYWVEDREIVESLVRRAEAAGYQALVLTLDNPMLGWRNRDLRKGYLPFLGAEGIAQFTSDPVFRSRLGVDPVDMPEQAAELFLSIFGGLHMGWDDVAWIKELTSLPLVVKGLLSSADARLALDAGADGIVVSNHGARQVDGAVAAIDALPAIVEAVGGQASVLFDSGIRRAADVVRAIALGAEAVLVGRLYMYGLAVGGREGVEMALQDLIDELDRTLVLCGCSSLADLGAASLARRT